MSAPDRSRARAPQRGAQADPTSARASRRGFLQASGALAGAFVFGFRIPDARAAGAGPAVREINAWIVIHPDDRVVIRIARSEMGQGTLTALAQLVAEELDCDWSNVRTEFASPNEHFRRNRVWGSMSTGGSMGVRSSHDYVRQAGASARTMLVQAAAARWKAPPQECVADRGVVTHAPSGRRLRYGELAADAAALAPPQKVALRDPRDWKIAGKPLHRLDLADKVLGRPVFGTDVDLPGMLHASIAQCPVFGGTLASLDASDAERSPGVRRVLRERDFVAVVADSWWRANEALRKLKPRWDGGANEKVDDAAIEKMLRDGLAQAGLPKVHESGDVPGAFAAAARVIEAEYRSPYLAHATMEPQVCTAWFKPDGSLEVWTSTQNGEASMQAASQASGLPLERIEVHKTMLGGGFGRRGGPQDFVALGVRVARAMNGAPVKTMWSREEDMRHDFYRPASIVRMRAGVDARGGLVAMHTRIACPSILDSLGSGRGGGVDFSAVRPFDGMPYAVPNQLVEYAKRNGHVPVGFWRGPGQQNWFYRESFVDELAVAAERDPLEYRLSMLGPRDKCRAVLEAAAKAAGWGSPLPAGVHRGIALGEGFGSYAACVAEASVDDKGEVKVHRVVVAIDSGHVVNPDTCAAQAESNVVYGLGPVLYQEVRVRDGRVVESNFHNFRLPDISEMPKVETVLVPSGGFWGGHGEPAILPLAPAVCNAIYRATGRRVRSLPVKHVDLRRA